MTDFKDFLDQIKIRLTNPLIFSFLISWVIIHWQIFVGGFYLTTKDLEELGHANFLDFVQASINWSNGIWYPLLSAIVYTVISPLVRIGIQLFNTWINKKGNDQIRKVASDSFVPYEMYDKILFEVQTQRGRNESLVTENISLSNEIDVKKNEIRENGLINNNLQMELTKSQNQISSMFDSSFLKGNWRLIIKNNSDNILQDLIIRIKSNDVEVRQKDGHYLALFNLVDFVKNQTGDASFLFLYVNKTPKNETKQFDYYSRIKENGNRRLTGRFDDKYDVIFEGLTDDELDKSSDAPSTDPLLISLL